MDFFGRLLNRIFRSRLPAAQAYDLWASTYDEQTNNLMLYLDDDLIFKAAHPIDWRGKDILDFGCGTGRHWPKLLAYQPHRLTGVDISSEMLGKLKGKYPGADVYQIKQCRLPMFAAETFDIVLSNLALGYVKDVGSLFCEWARVLRPEGLVLVTDLHPAALKKGAKNDFKWKNRMIEIENYVHELSAMQEAAMRSGLRMGAWDERKIDVSNRRFFERAGALDLYEKWQGAVIIYKLCLVKAPGGVSGAVQRQEGS